MTATDYLQLSNISEELAHLWDTELGRNKIRACLFTLIIYTQKTEKIASYGELIKKVIGKFPCRILWIIEDVHSDERYLKTEVSSQTIGEGDLSLFCEQIKIETAGDYRERVPYLLLPYLVPDLPIYLFWTADPTGENVILSRLQPYAHRIIFDSEGAADIQAFSHTILKLVGDNKTGVTDLNWISTWGWRNIFRSVFNSRDTVDQLIQSNRLRITYNKNPSSQGYLGEIRAAYFQAWLASQLNWKFTHFEHEEGNYRLAYHRAMGDLAIHLAPVEQKELPIGAILSIEIESSLKKGHYIFKRHPESRQVYIQYSDANHCDLPYCFYLGGFAAGQEILEEIFYETTGEHYKNMLQTLSQIPWKH
ncbi:MAG: glucose-6-phosphate dehydrogenase assembly protein OpcA [Chlamydiia bacterium]|nr:glucose-6-phosphate dehydrogenase assembly protein OpcA [Chlamydiia bacterium]